MDPALTVCLPLGSGQKTERLAQHPGEPAHQQAPGPQKTRASATARVTFGVRRAIVGCSGSPPSAHPGTSTRGVIYWSFLTCDGDIPTVDGPKQAPLSIASPVLITKVVSCVSGSISALLREAAGGLSPCYCDSARDWGCTLVGLHTWLSEVSVSLRTEGHVALEKGRT